MPEYIDKTALYKEILLLESCQRELAEEKEVDEYTFIKRQQALEAAICYRQFVANFPAADVAPVVHGEWMRYSRTLWHYCSVCLEDALMSKSTGTEVLSSFCPHCGAKMD